MPEIAVSRTSQVELAVAISRFKSGIVVLEVDSQHSRGISKTPD